MAIDNSTPSRACTSCKQIKLLTSEFFNRCSRSKTGFISACKECKRKYLAEHYKKNAERKKLYAKSVRKNNPEKIKEKNQNYVERNREKVNAYNRNYYHKHIEKNHLKSNKYYQLNKDKISEKSIVYRLKNKEKINKRSVDFTRNKRNTDPMFRIRLNIGRAIRYRLKTSKDGNHVFDLLGYNAGDLKRHLEKQFTNGMTWENYGKWHIDHILPAQAFSVNSIYDDELKAYWALTNLRPLWAIDNLKKKDKILYIL